MKALFYDTETTGLPLWREPSEDPRQPHLVQLAALLVDLETRSVLSSIDLTIAPDGWVIPDEVAAIHGITTELAAATGVGEVLAVNLLLDLWRRAHVRIAHNEPFDARIVRIAQHRYTQFSAHIDPWHAGVAECTQRLATPILKLPPTDRMVAAGFNRPKQVNLREAYRHFMGHDLVGAHRAIIDAEACRQVYFAIKAAAVPT